jgi:hypothetical protein
MMEQWNSGIMGSGIMQCWINGPATGGDFIEANNLTFFVMVIKNWCQCPPLINIFRQIMTNKIWRINSRLDRLIDHIIP